MRPRLKSDTFFVPVTEGVYIRNNKNSFVLKGKGLAALLERVAPLMNGQYELADLAQAFPLEKRPILQQLVQLLTENGCLRDAALDRPYVLPPAMLERYAPALTFIEYHQSSPAYRFQQFLTTPVLAIASGEPLLALAHALLETGNRTITLLDTGEASTNYARLYEMLSILQNERDPELTLQIVKTESWEEPAFPSPDYQNRLKEFCASAHMVLYAGVSEDSLHYADTLSALCQQVGVAFLPAVSIENELHAGPLFRPGLPGCWQCYWRRRQAAHGLPAYDERGETAVPDRAGKLFTTPEMLQAPDMGKAAIGIVANILALEFFKYASDITHQTLAEQVYILDLQRLQNVKHTLFPHPLCTNCNTAHADDLTTMQLWTHNELYRQQQVRQTISEKEILAITERWADQNSGLVSSITDADYVQLPLVRARVQTTLAATRPYLLPMNEAAGLDYAEVRLLAVREALARYLESLAGESGELYSRTSVWEYSQEERVPPERIFGWQELGTRKEAEEKTLAWLWAIDLEHPEQGWLVPSAAVFRWSHWNRFDTCPLYAPEAGGTGLGACWSEALTQGLLSLCSAIAMPLLPERLQAPATRILAREAYCEDRLCAAYLSMLDILGIRALLLDITDYENVPSLPAYAVLMEASQEGATQHSMELCSTVFTHWHPLPAIRQALQAAVLRWQVEHDPATSEHAHLAACWSPVSASWRDKYTLCNVLPIPLSAETDAIAGGSILQSSLKSLGWNVAVVPLPQDPTVARLFPCALRLLAIRQAEKEEHD